MSQTTRPSEPPSLRILGNIAARTLVLPRKLTLSGPFRNILTGAACFLLTTVLAVSGYVLAGWSLLDSIYMVVITVFGVGFGEVQPVTAPALRIFTIFVIIAGSTSVVYMIGGFVQLLTEGEIKRALETRRMTRSIDKLTNHVLICGFGRIGQILAQELARGNQPFVVIDNNPERIAEAEALDYLVFTGNATDEGVLNAVGIERAKFLASVLPDDALNVFITLTARGLNPELVILSRGELASTEKKLRQAGADHVVLPATIGALRMVHMITHPAAVDYLDSSDGGNTLNELLSEIDLQMDELAIGDTALVGRSVSEVELEGKGIFLIVALRRLDGSTITRPDGPTILAAGDTLIVMGHKGGIPQFARNYALKRQMLYRGAKL